MYADKPGKEVSYEQVIKPQNKEEIACHGNFSRCTFSGNVCRRMVGTRRAVCMGLGSP